VVFQKNLKKEFNGYRNTYAILIQHGHKTEQLKEVFQQYTDRLEKYKSKRNIKDKKEESMLQYAKRKYYKQYG
jgi:hypothetical protein